MEIAELEPSVSVLSPVTIPLDRSFVLVRAGMPSVLASLGAFSADAATDVTDALARGIGVDEALPSYAATTGRRAIAYRRRGAPYVGIIREGKPGSVHDVPLARRLSRELKCPAVALHVAARDVALELFHAGRSIESWLVVSGEVACATSAFEIEAASIAEDPYGRALALLEAYGFEDDRLAFEDFARGDIVLRRWDVTVARCHGFADLGFWPRPVV